MMADITPAAGWVVLDCDSNALEQDIRLVCANDETESESCAHLFAQGGPVNKVLRLPESVSRLIACGLPECLTRFVVRERSIRAYRGCEA